MRKSLVVVTLMTVLLALSCNKEELTDGLFWETESHFTGDRKGSYTMTVDSVVYNDLDSDIALAVGELGFLIKVHDSLNIIVRITNVPQIDGEKYIGGSEHVDSCYLQLVPKENGMELTPQQIYELSFIGTTGTVKRTAKDRIEVTAVMKDDQGLIDRQLEAEIYIGSITLDNE